MGTSVVTQEIIDVEIIEEIFPEGMCIAMVKGEPDGSAFDYWIGEDKNMSEWKELLISNQTGEMYIVDGQTAFVNTKTGEIVETTDTAVKQIDDMVILWKKEEGIEPDETMSQLIEGNIGQIGMLR